MARGRLLSTKLLIEGLEVPMETATFTSTVNQASTCYITVPPHKTIKNIKPRSYVELFVLDPSYPDTTVDRPYVLAWDGEVFGYTMTKSAAGRNFQLTCIDVSNYWDNVSSFYLTSASGEGGTMHIGAVGIEQQAAIAQNFKQHAVGPSKISYFKTRMENFQADLAAGNSELAEAKPDFLNALLAIYNDIALMNDFYAAAEERLRISDRIKIRSSGALYELLKENENLEYLEGVMGRASGLQTLRQTVNDLMSIIFHDGVAVPFPGAVKRPVTGPGLDKPVKGQQLASSQKRTIGQFLFKPNLFMMPPPMCNVFFPEEYSQFTYSRNFFEEPTRFTYAPVLPQKSQDTREILLMQKFEPPSFKNFMVGKAPTSEFQGDDDLLIPTNIDPGRFKERDETASAEITKGVKGPAQFLTNEELMKGIWGAREGRMPSSTAFRASPLEATTAEQTDFYEDVARYLFFKKRFQRRTCSITSTFKPSVVPGFSCLILDDSEAEQNVVAYVNSVSHTVSATGGGYTQVQLSYARDVTEQDVASDKGARLLIPRWFAKDIFGEMKIPDPAPSGDEEVKALGIQHVTDPVGINKYYEDLLGVGGSKAITGITEGQTTLAGATRALLDDYRSKKSKQQQNILDDFIYDMTARDYVRFSEALRFIGAKMETPSLGAAEFVELTGGAFERTGKIDQRTAILRRNVIRQYTDALKAGRGFRG